MSILYNLNTKSNKQMTYVLRTVFGIGLFYSKKICQSLGYDYTVKMNELMEKDLNKFNSLITIKYKLMIDTELKKNIYDNIQTLKMIKSYKGIRHTYNLPVNGQRTHTNAKTRRR